MAGDSSEEKNLPPSQKKLREARKKGQIAKSRDMVSGAALAGGLGYLILGGGGIMAQSAAMFQQASEVSAGDFGDGVAAMLPVIRGAMLGAVAPLLVLAPVLVILVSMVMMRGVPFSTDPISPKFTKLNPAEGFKKMFGLHAMVELLKAVFKVVVIVAVFIAVLIGGLQALTLAPSCGIGCEVSVFGALTRPLLASAALLFVLAGAADYGLQHWLFMRDQKMSISEQKRERKDMNGDPVLRRERHRLMNEALRLAGGLGMKRATVVITGPGDIMIGLRYKIAEMPAPVVVVRGRGERGRSLLAEALSMKLPMAEDDELATGLFRVPLGHGIPEPMFRPMALALRRAGSL